MNSSELAPSPDRQPAPARDASAPPAGESSPRPRHVALYFDLVQTPVRREHTGAWTEPRTEGLRALRRSSFRFYQESSLPLE